MAFGYRSGKAFVALKLDNDYVWDCSALKVGGEYHMFSSRWTKELGFGWNWLFHSEIIHCVSERPEGPYRFVRSVLPRRGRKYFDGMNTHNPCIKYFDGKFYLYYMGATYGGNIPAHAEEISDAYGMETWNRKRIGVAVADDIYGEFVRRDEPVLLPRDCSFWDCTITTNPSVTIFPDGRTYMIYKSRRSVGSPLQLGVAVSDRPDGPFRRLSDEPVLQFSDENLHVEDPYLWYDRNKKKFCIIAKDDSKNGSTGITGEWGAGFYAESEDCIRFEIAERAPVYTRNLCFRDGRRQTQCNLERPSLLFDEDGTPTHLFCATGDGSDPYAFQGVTYVVGMNLEEKGLK